MKRLLMVAVLAVIAAGVYATLAPLREETSAARVSERLTAVFKRPVRVADTDFRFSPTPRLLVRGIDVGGQFKADEVSLLINWKDLWSAIRGGNWVWSEALIAPMAEGAAENQYGELPEPVRHKIRAHTAAVDNIALFFGEDIFIAIGSILLIRGFLEQNGILVEPTQLAIWAIPTAICAFVIHCTRLLLLDRSLRADISRRREQP